MNLKFPQAVSLGVERNDNVLSLPRVVRLSHEVKQMDPTVRVMAICLNMDQRSVDYFRIVLNQICGTRELKLEELYQLESVCEGITRRLATKMDKTPTQYKDIVIEGNESWSAFAMRLWGVGVDLADEATKLLTENNTDPSDK